MNRHRYGAEITLENFPQPPIVGQFFEMDFNKLDKDKRESR